MTYRELAFQAALLAVGAVVCTVIAITTKQWIAAVIFGIAAPFFALRAWQFYRAGQESKR